MTGSVLLMADGTGAKVGLSLAMVKTCRWPDQAPGSKKDLVPKLPLSALAHAVTHAYTLTKTVTTNARAHIHKHDSHTFRALKLDIRFLITNKVKNTNDDTLYSIRGHPLGKRFSRN